MSSNNERGRAAKRRSSIERAPLFRVRGFFVCDYCLLKWEWSETFFRPDASFCRACPECYEPTEPRRTAALRLCRSCDCFPCQCHRRKAIAAKNKTTKPAKAKSNATQKVLKKKSVPAKSKPKGKKQTKPVSKATKLAQKIPAKAKSKAVSKGKKQTKPKPSSQAQGRELASPSKAKPVSKPAKQTKGVKPAKAKSNVSQKSPKGKKQNKPKPARSASQAQGSGRAVPSKTSNATKAKAPNKKNAPKAKAQRKKQQNKAKAKGPKRSRPQNGKVYGYHRCSECHRGWESAYTYVENGKAQYGQQCKSCRSKKHHKAYDWKATQKTCPKCKALSDLKEEYCDDCGHCFDDDDVHIDPNKKHIQALCARCRHLPQPCSARY